MPKVRHMVAAWLVAVTLVSGCTARAPSVVDSKPSAGAKTYQIDSRDVTQLYAAAKKEGQLSLYIGGYSLEQGNAYVAEFKKAFPDITVDVYRAATGVVQERFLSEARSGKFLADVLLQGDHISLKSIIKEGYLLAYDLPGKDKFDPKFITDTYVYPHSVVYVGPAVNTNLVKPEEIDQFRKSWKYATDPKWKGKVAITPPGAGGTAYGPIYLFLGEQRSAFGPELIQALKLNIGKVFPSAIPATAEVAAGEYAVFLHASTTAVAGPAAQNAPIQIVYPPPTPAILVSGAIVNKGPNPNAAKLFFEWAFSKEGQEKEVQVIGNPSARKDVPVDPFSKYSWYKPPTEIWVPQDVDAYVKGLTTLGDEWHRLMSIPK